VFCKPAQHRQLAKGRNKMRQDIEISNEAIGHESRLGLAIAISISMIFTSYAVSVLNHHDDGEMNAQIYTNRPAVVSYLA
jgi:hypothetical protein